MDAATIGQVVLSGLATGSIYGLLALGLILILNTTGVANFAQGEIGLFATFLAYTAITGWALPGLAAVLVALVIGVGSACILGLLVERVAIRPVADQPLLTVAVVTLGLYFLFHGVIGLIYGPDIRTFPPLFGSGALRLGGTVISLQQLGIIAVSFGAALGLGAWLKYARAGIASRALVQSPLGASVCGVPTRKLKARMWAVGLGMSGLAGILIAPVAFLSQNLMLGLLISAFAAATLGGLGSLPGAFVGGLVLGLLESVAKVYVAGSLATAIGLVVILFVLLVRPSGLMGAKYVERV